MRLGLAAERDLINHWRNNSINTLMIKGSHMKIITLQEARSLGLKRYFTGEPCKYGHVSERITAGRRCLECKNDQNKKYMQVVRDSMSKEDKDKASKYLKEYYKNNKEAASERASKYYENNKEETIKRSKEWRDNNKEAANKRVMDKYYSCEKTRMKYAMRQMIRKAALHGSKRKKSRTDSELGYKETDLIRHIESKFLDGMTWDNYGEWHIDHIKPIKMFFDEGVTCIKTINALSNLQPLWAVDNLSKGCRFIG